MSSASLNPKEARALLLIALLGAAVSVAGFPMATAIPNAVGMAFLVPLALVAIGRLREQRALQIVAGAILAALLAALVFGLVEILVAVLLIGPVVAIYFVGTFLARLDRVGGTIWLVTTSLGLVLGVLGRQASPPGAAGAALVLAALGSFVMVGRLRRAAAQDQRR